MIARLSTAAVLVPLVAYLVLAAAAEAFLAFIVLVCVAGVVEWSLMAGRGGARPLLLVAVPLAPLCVVSFAEPQVPLGAVLGAAILLTPIGAIVLRSEPKSMLAAVHSTLAATVFMGIGLGHLVGLRSMGDDRGRLLLVLLFVCVICADSGAFVVGKWLGRTKFAPLVSPKKTWEGTVAGWLASLLAALAVRHWHWPELALGHALAIGLLLAVCAQLGDLTISMVKRAYGAKDASHILPGHGGSLDRSDSLLFSSPALYYYALFLVS